MRTCARKQTSTTLLSGRSPRATRQVKPHDGRNLPLQAFNVQYERSQMFLSRGFIF